MANQTGIHSHSSVAASESYIVFSGEPSRIRNFFASNPDIGARELVGCYKGTRERSYICNATHFAALQIGRVLYGEESVLVLGPINGAGGTRPATLHFLDAECIPVSLGYFVEVSREEAQREEAWTYDPDSGKFYVCRHRVFDGRIA